MSKSIPQFTEKTDQENDDLFHIVRAGIDYKQKRSNILAAKRIYKASVTQSGIGAPTVNVFENTIGAIVWSYDSVGIYSATLTSMFPDITKVPTICGLTAPFVNFGKFVGSAVSADVFQFMTFDYPGPITADNLFENTLITIEIYE